LSKKGFRDEKLAEEMSKLDVKFDWCRSGGDAVRLSRLFADNLTTSYISHAELQGPRAIDASTWSPDIGAILEADLTSRIDQPLDAVPGEKTSLLAFARAGGGDVAVCLISFSRTSPVAYTEIEDMVVVSAARGKGVGHAFMQWIAEQSKQRAIRRLFLESGITNTHAHEFFEEVGFHQVSIVMMKSLE
jgi:GNAT superfamily N-acetyltransferase